MDARHESSEGRILGELQLIQCSLLPDEHLTFLDDSEAWTRALEQYSEGVLVEAPLSEALFSIQLDGRKVWFEFRLKSYLSCCSNDCVSVKGENISRDEQEKWQAVIAESLKDIQDSDAEYPMFQLISTYLLPLLREDVLTLSQPIQEPSHATLPTLAHSSSKREIYHALFTSHHLISPNKRRSLQQWSYSLSLVGFAKVGYPGVIYAQGEKANIEEFVDNVKVMQWLALKLRFVETLPKENGAANVAVAGGRSWKEFEKVGEVVEEMRRLGREEYVVEMGIGSAGTK